MVFENEKGGQASRATLLGGLRDFLGEKFFSIRQARDGPG
jgi:hypothetical protein